MFVLIMHIAVLSNFTSRSVFSDHLSLPYRSVRQLLTQPSFQFPRSCTLAFRNSSKLFFYEKRNLRRHLSLKDATLTTKSCYTQL